MVESAINWKDKETYAYLKNATSKSWAWEFLRRNPTYKDAYQAHVNGAATNASKNKSILNVSEPDPKHIAVPVRGSYRRKERTNASPLTLQPEDFMLFKLADPNSRYDKSAVRFRPVVSILHFDSNRTNEDGSSKTRVLRAKFSGEVVALFDVRFNIEPQVALAKQRLKKWQTQLTKRKAIQLVVPRDRSDKYVWYLRVLDAKEADSASRAKIAEVLSLETEDGRGFSEKDITNFLKIATELRDSKYTGLLFLSK